MGCYSWIVTFIQYNRLGKVNNRPVYNGTCFYDTPLYYAHENGFPCESSTQPCVSADHLILHQKDLLCFFHHGSLDHAQRSLHVSED